MAESGNVKVHFVNNEGGGFANFVETPAGTNLGTFFGTRMAGQDPNNYLIRVNREEQQAEYVLADGDRVTITPVKVAGAA